MPKDGTFFKIEAFMRNELDLKGNELMAYALIYGFQKSTGKPFDGSQEFISEWLGSSRSHVNVTLQNLVKKGLLEKITTEHGRAKAYTCNAITPQHVRKSNNSEQQHVRKSNNSEQQHVRKSNINMLENLTSDVRKSNINMLENLTQYNNNTIGYNIHTDSGRKEFCFMVLKTITQNPNLLDSDETRNAFFAAAEKLEDADHTQTADEIVFIWNSMQTEMKLEGREAQFMPNLKKWLESEAVSKIRQSRTGKYYSIGRCVEQTNQLATKHGVAK